MENHLRAKIVAALAAVLLSSVAFAGEKVQITGSTSVLLPKPTDALQESKRSRRIDGPSGRSEYEGGLPQSGPVLNTSPEAEKKVLDMLDKKKNWIFANPYEMQFDSKTEEFLKGEKGTGLFNHRLMKDDDKSLLERYFTEKKSDHDVSGSKPESDNSADRQGKEHQYGNLKSQEPPDDKPNSTKLEPGVTLPPAIDNKSIFSSDRNTLQERLERTPFSESGMDKSEKLRERELFTREEREARDAELGKLYQPRMTGASKGVGGLDPLNTSIDATRQEATPFSGRRSDQLFNLGRNEPGAAGRNGPIFTGPSVAGPGSGLNAPTSSRSDFDFSSRAPQASAFSPSASVAPRTTPGASMNAPFILPRPQRKF